MRGAILIGALAVWTAAGQQASVGQPAGPAFHILVIGGEGSINNVKQRTAREPIVEVRDENNRPIAGAAVLFEAPQQGASGTFTGGSNALRVTTNAQGRAVGQGFRPNTQAGQFGVKVSVTVGNVTQTTTIAMTNVLAGAGAGAGAGVAAAAVHTKLIAILVIVAAAAAGGTVAAVKATSGSGPTTAPTTISAGTGTVGGRIR